ncbi:cytochrome P450 [Bradyrhizobium viridifuturi]|jgi:cytochrome P450|uniref:cytochrome P450 n=2 Tax=Pseudomonadota TaxID=1224 RepID=UPI000A514937|nr:MULTISPECIES: cytochrome P450 [Bradyrhizobium]QRI68051.1 cytochrome P450 [Bradyrhizobium sp. PSBB068]MBR1022984.1 cytochrome P450 [Bradyrhizobium viridifuturi]MBR1040017.1 cytochrome P450 [Bradyrhizobium viridifuturi]MBR1047528.1 cytochrome P450 [Bradyrhizobium viridifuturi]MBR1077017.1 cytochrome P450 [Bradyrhizobium viridifuturi]
MNEQVQPASGEPLFNPLAPEFIRNPYPYYERLRRLDPMHVNAHGAFVASRHAEASLVLRDKRFGKDYVDRTIRRYGPKIMEEPVFRSMSHWMLQQDPPDHTRLRGLVVKAFTARRVEDMRPRIQQIVDETLDRIIPQGRMDLIDDFAFRLPVTIICDMLGIPEEQREAFYTGSRDGGRLLDPVPLSAEEIKKGNAGNVMAAMYFHQLFELRRRQPGDDLTTQLVQAEEDGQKLTNEELTANIILLFGAGHETTVNLIGNGLLALYRNPDQLALLKANPGLITNAIEEFLRYDSSVQLTGRVALEDIEDLGGKRIPKGESVLCLLGSANHDEAVYPDHPEKLDIQRPNVKPLSFGGGIHFCLGAQLARIEAEIAISTLLRRIPDLRLDDAENPEWRPTFVLRGLKRLPASW